MVYLISFFLIKQDNLTIVTMKSITDYASILMIPLSLVILLTACSEEDEPAEETADQGAFEMKCTGGLRFEASGTMDVSLFIKTDLNQAVLVPSFHAPDGQWTDLHFNIWNDGDEVADKLYLIYPYEPGEEYVDTGEAVSAVLHNAEFQYPFGWNSVEKGQIEFEYYSSNRVKGWFHFIMPSNVPRDPEVEDITISGTFDAPYTTHTQP